VAQLKINMVTFHVGNKKGKSLDGLVDILKELWTEKSFDKEKEENKIQNPLKREVFVIVRDNGKLIGLGKVVTIGFVSCITRFVISKEYRGKGLGKKLLSRLIGAAKKRSCKFMVLTSAGYRKHAHKFYEMNGFSRIYLLFFRFL
jgi:GNAT superfamily N-acetyltransferase